MSRDDGQPTVVLENLVSAPGPVQVFLDTMIAARCEGFAVALGHEWGLALDDTHTPFPSPT